MSHRVHAAPARRERAAYLLYGDALGKVGRRGMWEKQMGAQSGGAAGEERKMACANYVLVHVYI